MAPTIEIAGRLVGPEHPPLVIAEVGINHGGDLTTACEMVDAAAEAGAEVVKHQTHVVDDEMSAAARLVVPGNTSESIYDVMASCALDEEDERSLKEHVERRGMTFLSTPFSRAAADRLERLGVDAYKIGSGECNNLPLLRHVAGFGKLVVMSTGMNTIDDIARSVDQPWEIRRQHAAQVIAGTAPASPLFVNQAKAAGFKDSCDVRGARRSAVRSAV